MKNFFFLPYFFVANFHHSVVESLPSDFPCGIYYGWAKLNNDPVRKMVVSAGWNPHFKDLKKKAIVSIKYNLKPTNMKYNIQ